MTNTALDADVLVDHVGKFPFSTNGANRAVPRADSTACAGTILDFVLNQAAADFGRAAFLVDVSFVFIHKMHKRGNNRIWRALSKTAEAVASNLLTQFLQLFDVSIFTATITDSFQYLKKPVRANAARNAFPA